MAGTDRPDGPRRDDAAHDVQIRTFLIGGMRGYTLFTQERGDEAAAKLAAKSADIARARGRGSRGAAPSVHADWGVMLSPLWVR